LVTAFEMCKKIVIRKFRVGLRTLNNVIRNSHFTDDVESQIFGGCSFFWHFLWHI